MFFAILIRKYNCAILFTFFHINLFPDGSWVCASLWFRYVHIIYTDYTLDGKGKLYTGKASGKMVMLHCILTYTWAILVILILTVPYYLDYEQPEESSSIICKICNRIELKYDNDEDFQKQFVRPMSMVVTAFVGLGIFFLFCKGRIDAKV